MRTGLAGTASLRTTTAADDADEDAAGVLEEGAAGLAQRLAAINQKKKIESETLLISKRLFFLLCCYVFVCTVMLWYDTIGLYAGLGFAPVSLETFDFNSSASAAPSLLSPQLDGLELSPRSVDPLAHPREPAAPTEDDPADDEARTEVTELSSAEQEPEQVQRDDALVLDARRMKQSANKNMPTPMDLEGFTQWGTCSFPSRCEPPYLHLIVPHQSRRSCLARLVRAFGPHTHDQDDVACTCLMVADVLSPPPNKYKKRRRAVAAEPTKSAGDTDLVMETIHAWPGPHVLLRWKGAFGKLVALDQMFQSITAPATKSIVFVLDVDMVVKQGVIEELRSIPELGKSFYAPIVWKLKAPPYPVSEEELEKEPHGSVVVKNTTKHGAWRTSGWGMLAFYKDDFDKIGGFGAVERSMFNNKKSIWKWGMEDTLHAAVMRESLEQVRRPAQNLIHFYHER